MEPVSVMNMIYEKSNTMTVHGNYQHMMHYLKNGFYMKEERNGFWILVKPTTVIMQANYHTFNIKNLIMDYYNKNKMSEKMTENFKMDMLNGNVKLAMDNGMLKMV